MRKKRFRSRGRHLCKFIGTKEWFYIRKNRSTPKGLVCDTNIAVNYLFCYTNRDFTIRRRDGSENVISKAILRSFSLYCDYSYPFTSSKVGESPWRWIHRIPIQVQKKKRAKKCTKRRDARAELLFCLLNGPVHVNAFSFENAYNSMPLDLPSTLIRWAFSSKTHRFVNV